MRIGVIGAGRAALTLSPLLEAAGHEIQWRWTRGTGAAIDGLEPVALILLCVSDHAIEEVAASLAPREGSADEVWLHLSGSQASTLARVDAERPRAAGVLHPLVALPGTGASPTLLQGASCGVAGDPDAVALAKVLASDLGLVPCQVQDEFRPLVHAAAVSVAGHATALLAQASAMLEAAGFEESDARRALSALMATAIENLKQGPPHDVITGPIARGDVETLRGHLEALSEHGQEGLRTYIELGRTALKLSAGRLNSTQVAAINSALMAFYVSGSDEVDDSEPMRAPFPPS